MAALALGACGGGERQDAGAPSGAFRVDVTRASFPARQGLAEAATLRLDVRNTGRRAVPDLAVTVETARVGAGRRRAAAREGAAAATGAGGGATGGFGIRAAAPGLADDGRPVWLLDAEPAGGHTAYVGTWAFGPLPRRGDAQRPLRPHARTARPLPRALAGRPGAGGRRAAPARRAHARGLRGHDHRGPGAVAGRARRAGGPRALSVGAPGRAPGGVPRALRGRAPGPAPVGAPGGRSAGAERSGRPAPPPVAPGRTVRRR